MAEYQRVLKKVWEEMERLYGRDEFVPQQEADVQAYLYHGLLNQLKGEICPKDLRMEETMGRIGRVDLNVNDRIFIEIKLLGRQESYGKRAWNKKVRSELEKDADKLERYVKKVRATNPEILQRQPILALWNWKAQGGLDGDLIAKLKSFRKNMKSRGIKVLYGPRRRSSRRTLE